MLTGGWLNKISTNIAAQLGWQRGGSWKLPLPGAPSCIITPLNCNSWIQLARSVWRICSDISTINFFGGEKEIIAPSMPQTLWISVHHLISMLLDISSHMLLKSSKALAFLFVSPKHCSGLAFKLNLCLCKIDCHVKGNTKLSTIRWREVAAESV